MKFFSDKAVEIFVELTQISAMFMNSWDSKFLKISQNNRNNNNNMKKHCNKMAFTIQNSIWLVILQFLVRFKTATQNAKRIYASSTTTPTKQTGQVHDCYVGFVWCNGYIVLVDRGIGRAHCDIGVPQYHIHQFVVGLNDSLELECPITVYFNGAENRQNSCLQRLKFYFYIFIKSIDSLYQRCEIWNRIHDTQK